MGAEREVVARRAEGGGQRFVLEVSGDGRRWGVVQWAAKPRESRGEFAPWWFTEGVTWHLFNGEPPVVARGEAPPVPTASFGTLAEVKVYVLHLAQGSGG